jgi:hypothetical protein
MRFFIQAGREKAPKLLGPVTPSLGCKKGLSRFYYGFVFKEFFKFEVNFNAWTAFGH